MKTEKGVQLVFYILDFKNVKKIVSANSIGGFITYL